MTILARTAATAAALATGTVLATGALADAHAMDMSTMMSADQLTEAGIYRLDVDADDTLWGDGLMYEGETADWEEIGEVDDVLFDSEGKIAGVLVEVGGFIGIGEKNVMIPMADLRLSSDEDGEYFFITNYTQEQLEEMPEIDDDL